MGNGRVQLFRSAVVTRVVQTAWWGDGPRRVTGVCLRLWPSRWVLLLFPRRGPSTYECPSCDRQSA